MIDELIKYLEDLKRSSSKKEIEEKLNNLFGVEIKWSKLTRKELDNVIEGVERLAKELSLESQLKYYLRKSLDNLLPPEKQGPFIRLLKSLLKE